MSRSYKKTPYCGDETSKWNKRLANKRVRRILKNPDMELQNSSYKKAYQSWNIVDYYFIQTFEEFSMNWGAYFGSIQEARNYWEKYYKRK
ncbi:MAG: hypothetical protein MJ222_01455 [Bacilli bacterium]|nr:hypothetical protein [Bacilli bacterium]